MHIRSVGQKCSGEPHFVQVAVAGVPRGGCVVLAVIFIISTSSTCFLFTLIIIMIIIIILGASAEFLDQRAEEADLGGTGAGDRREQV